MSNYDKELINSRIIEVSDYYAPGEGRREGQNRRIWECPVCGGDDFTANSAKQCAGCFSPGCEVPRTKDAVGLIAYFERLEPSGESFVRCLRKGYEILGIPEPENDGKRAKRSSTAHSVESGGVQTNSAQPSSETDPDREKDNSAEDGVSVNGGRTSSGHSIGSVAAAGVSTGSLGLLHTLHHGSSENGSSEQGSTQPSTVAGEDNATFDADQHCELVDQVYRAFLELCPLVDRDRQFWHSRGVNDDTILAGGFGSIWRERCYEVLDELQRRFGQDALVSVPGFYLSERERVHTNLFDDYTLIPYHDRDGYITMVQGRVPDTPEGNKPKYVAPVNSGLHLYVFPGYKPERVSAFVEGAVGAIVAAQSSIAVAAITGFQNYRIAGDKREADRPLPEHDRTDFGGRKIIYIPDEDVKPKTKDAVQAEAPKAARFLIESHGGTPFIARLPEGYKDLDEWLLSLDPDERIPRFAELMQSAMTPEQWQEQDRPTEAPNEGDQKEEGGQESDGEAQPEGRETAGQSKKDTRKSKEVRRTNERKDGETDSSERSSNEDGSGDGGEADQEDSANANSSKETEQKTPSPGLKRREPKPRTYKPIPTTNLGEFMVSLLYGLVAGVAFFALIVFSAPEWEPTSVMARVPVAVTATVSLVIVAAVLGYMCDRLYKRRWYALRDHLAGTKTENKTKVKARRHAHE